MKEATGELSGTVITVVAIAAVAAIFTAFILPAIRGGLTSRTKCASAICPSSCADDKCTCTYYPVDETTGVQGDPETIVCDNPNK